MTGWYGDEPMTPQVPTIPNRSALKPRAINPTVLAPELAYDGRPDALILWTIFINVREAPGRVVVRRSKLLGGVNHLDVDYDAFDNTQLARNYIWASYPDAALLQPYGVEQCVFEVWG